MRIKLAILILLVPIAMKSQNATATLGNVFSCEGENALVPMDVTGFIDVGSMQFYIAYDTNSAEFLSLQNINPAVPAPISVNANNGVIGLAYSHTVAFSIENGKLFDLSFTFLGGSTPLTFNPGTEIANIDLEVIPLTTTPGSIESSLVITGQPENVTTYPDSDVTFSVASAGTPDYQWQENPGSGWVDLQNNTTYTGVLTAQLTILDVPLSFDGRYYRCRLSEGSCNATSDSALLTVIPTYPVAALGVVHSCPASTVLEPLDVSQFLDVVEFTFNISFNTGAMVFTGFENLHADLVPANLVSEPLGTPPGISVHYSSGTPLNITSGKLFDMEFSYGSGDQMLLFEAGSVALNSQSNPIDITFSNGEIFQFTTPEILIQPQDITVSEFEDAIFQVEAENTTQYHWRISQDGGETWDELTEIPPYYDVTTPVLTISPATADMDGHRFSCRLNNTNCMIYSASAILHVDTLTYNAELERIALCNAYPVPFRDELSISLTDNYSCENISLYDIRGMRVYTYAPGDVASQQIRLDLPDLPEGMYFLRLILDKDGMMYTEQQKILKTN